MLIRPKPSTVLLRYLYGFYGTFPQRNTDYRYVYVCMYVGLCASWGLFDGHSQLSTKHTGEDWHGYPEGHIRRASKLTLMLVLSLALLTYTPDKTGLSYQGV